MAKHVHRCTRTVPLHDSPWLQYGIDWRYPTLVPTWTRVLSGGK